jgi:hypothetical protein
MEDSLQAQIDNVRASMISLEAQRDVLGDETVNSALATLREKLAILEEQAAAQAAPVDVI